MRRYRRVSVTAMLRPPLSIDIAEANAASPPSGPTLPGISFTAPTTSACTSRVGSPPDTCFWSPTPTPSSESGLPGSAVAPPESQAALKKQKWKADEDALLQRLVAEMATEGGKVRWSAVGAQALVHTCGRPHDGLTALGRGRVPVSWASLCVLPRHMA